MDISVDSNFFKTNIGKTQLLLLNPYLIFNYFFMKRKMERIAH